MSRMRLISIFLYDGEPDSLREADIKVSTIKAVAFRRSQLARAIEEVPELKSPGAYVLFGPNPNDDDRPTAYIGESQNVAGRLKGHLQKSNGSPDQNKYDHWVDTIALVSKDRSLTKAHALYLESRMADIAAKNPSWIVRSGRTPGEDAGSLPKHDKIVAEDFLTQGLLLVGTLGLDLFRSTSSPSAASPSKSPDLANPPKPTGIVLQDIDFRYSGNGFAAEMQVLPNGTFLIKKGAIVRRNEAPTLSSTAKKLRAGLLEKRLVLDDGQEMILNEDYSVEAVSTAASVVSGTTINGRNAWKAPDGRSYAQIEEALASAVSSSTDPLAGEEGSPASADD